MPSTMTITRTNAPPNSNSSNDNIQLTHLEHIEDQQHINSTNDPSPENNPTDSLANLRPITQTRQFLILISAFLTTATTIGINQSYGVFQSYYLSPKQTILTPPTTDPSQQQPALIAFVGTLSYGLTWAGALLLNPLLSRLSITGVRQTCTLGVLLMTIAFVLASISNKIWQLLLTQGLLFGIGASCLYFPILSSAPEYFESHRGAAMGFILSGAGIGGLVFSPTIRALLTAVGPQWTLRILALLNAAVTLPIAVTAAPSRFTGRRATHIPLSLAVKPSFLFSVAAAFLQAGGNGLPLTFLPEYSVAIGYSAAFGANLLAAHNGVNSVSRIVTGWMGDRWGRQNVLILMVIMSVACVVGFWLGSVGKGGDQGLWIGFVILYGIAGGGYNSLFPTTITEVFGLQAYASVIGFLYFVRGLGVTFGSPVGGQILGESKVSNYMNVVWYDAGLLGGAALCVMGVRCWDAMDKRVWAWKA